MGGGGGGFTSVTYYSYNLSSSYLQIQSSSLATSYLLERTTRICNAFIQSRKCDTQLIVGVFKRLCDF